VPQQKARLRLSSFFIISAVCFCESLLYHYHKAHRPCTKRKVLT
jgi:hypothetical protein